MIRIIVATLLLLLALLCLLFYMIGSHGKLMFRANMPEDVLIWGIAVLSASISFFLFVKQIFKSLKR